MFNSKYTGYSKDKYPKPIHIQGNLVHPDTVVPSKSVRIRVRITESHI
jgi:hypothetical protein